MIFNSHYKSRDDSEISKLSDYQKNNVPPHFERCNLNGTCFLDVRSVPRSKERGFQTLRHENFSNFSLIKIREIYYRLLFNCILFQMGIIEGNLMFL